MNVNQQTSLGDSGGHRLVVIWEGILVYVVYRLYVQCRYSYANSYGLAENDAEKKTLRFGF